MTNLATAGWKNKLNCGVWESAQVKWESLLSRRQEEQPLMTQRFHSIIPGGGCQQFKNTIPASTQSHSLFHVSSGSCSFSSIHLLPSPHTCVTAALLLAPLAQSQPCLPHRNPLLCPMPPVLPMPASLPLPHHPQPCSSPCFSHPSHKNMCSSLPYSCPLTSSLLRPAQQLPSEPHQSRLEYSAFKSFPLSPLFHQQKINTIGLETARTLYCSHSQDYQRCVKIPGMCEPALCHCWETLKPMDCGAA